MNDELEPRFRALLESERAVDDLSPARRAVLGDRIMASLSGRDHHAGAAPSAGGSERAPGSGLPPRRSGLAQRLIRGGALLTLGGALGLLGGRVLWRGEANIAPPMLDPARLPPAPRSSTSAEAPRGTAAPADTSAVSGGRDPRKPPAPADSSPVSSERGSPGPGARTRTPPGEVGTPRPSPIAQPAASSISSDLALERAPLERARAAIARRDGVSALEALDEHARSFPAGRLAEERDALTVQALVVRGRIEDARRKASEFERRYPASVFLPSIQAAVREP